MYLVNIGSFFKYCWRLLISCKPTPLVICLDPWMPDAGCSEIGHSWWWPEPESMARAREHLTMSDRESKFFWECGTVVKASEVELESANCFHMTVQLPDLSWPCSALLHRTLGASSYEMNTGKGHKLLCGNVLNLLSVMSVVKRRPSKYCIRRDLGR